MSTTYTGDPTATQAPASPPVDGSPPELTLPADGDPANAASIAQAFKVVADYIAFLFSPFAKGSAWIQAIIAYQTAVLHRRFGIDHLGFPGGNVNCWHENWYDVGFATKNTVASGAWFGNWFYSISGVAAGTIQTAAGSGGAAGADGGVSLTCSGTGITPNTAHVESAIAYPSGADTDLAVQWEGVFVDHADAEFDMGLYSQSPSMLGVTTAFSGLTQVGAAFVRRHTDTNWQIYTRAFGAGSATYTDSGVSYASTPNRFRIEVRGVNESDDGSARVLFYIMGALVANIPVDLGVGGLASFFRVTDTGATSNLQIARLLTAFNQTPGDIFL